jgi:hypothetical protein
MYQLDQRVRLADIPDAPFPSRGRAIGVIEDIFPPDETHGETLYTVIIDAGQRLACFEHEIEPVD